MEQKGFPETSATNYESNLRNIPEERRPQSHHGGSLKSRTACTVLRFVSFAQIIVSSKWHIHCLQTCKVTDRQIDREVGR